MYLNVCYNLIISILFIWMRRTSSTSHQDHNVFIWSTWIFTHQLQRQRKHIYPNWNGRSRWVRNVYTFTENSFDIKRLCLRGHNRIRGDQRSICFIVWGWLEIISIRIIALCSAEEPRWPSEYVSESVSSGRKYCGFFWPHGNPKQRENILNLKHALDLPRPLRPTNRKSLNLATRPFITAV